MKNKWEAKCRGRLHSRDSAIQETLNIDDLLEHPNTSIRDRLRVECGTVRFNDPEQRRRDILIRDNRLQAEHKR
jgi:hypothetical protein